MVQQRNSIKSMEYISSGETKWLVVEHAGRLVQFSNSCNDFHRFNSYNSNMELQLSLYSTVWYIHTVYTIQVKKKNG
jgi:hypothetical protein